MDDRVWWGIYGEWLTPDENTRDFGETMTPLWAC